MKNIGKLLVRMSQIPKPRKSQAGEIPVGTILVIGLIAIPLVIALIILREDIYLFFIDQWVEFVTSG